MYFNALDYFVYWKRISFHFAVFRIRRAGRAAALYFNNLTCETGVCHSPFTHSRKVNQHFFFLQTLNLFKEKVKKKERWRAARWGGEAGGEENRGEERGSNYWRLFKGQQRLKEKSGGEQRSGGLESGERERKNKRKERETAGEERGPLSYKWMSTCHWQGLLLKMTAPPFSLSPLSSLLGLGNVFAHLHKHSATWSSSSGRYNLRDREPNWSNNCRLWTREAPRTSGEASPGPHALDSSIKNNETITRNPATALPCCGWLTKVQYLLYVYCAVMKEKLRAQTGYITLNN